jgi:hypothetical protein
MDKEDIGGGNNDKRLLTGADYAFPGVVATNLVHGNSGVT